MVLKFFSSTRCNSYAADNDGVSAPTALGLERSFCGLGAPRARIEVGVGYSLAGMNIEEVGRGTVWLVLGK